jgi:hypothetical protein
MNADYLGLAELSIGVHCIEYTIYTIRLFDKINSLKHVAWNTCKSKLANNLCLRDDERGW